MTTIRLTTMTMPACDVVCGRPIAIEVSLRKLQKPANTTREHEIRNVKMQNTHEVQTELNGKCHIKDAGTIVACSISQRGKNVGERMILVCRHRNKTTMAYFIVTAYRTSWGQLTTNGYQRNHLVNLDRIMYHMV